MKDQLTVDSEQGSAVLQGVEQDLVFLRGHVQRFNRLIDALESSPLIAMALKPTIQLPQPMPLPTKADGGEVRTLAQVERDAILHAVAVSHGDAVQAAIALMIGRTTIYRKLREYGYDTRRKEEAQ
jgi:DNA-binding NtrC family response regulator